MTSFAADGYDDALVTLGDGAVNVDGVMVAGSRSFVRDPRLSRLADSEGRLKRHNVERFSIGRIPLDEFGKRKYYCDDCDSWQKRAAFSTDGRNKNGTPRIRHTCKTCDTLRMAQKRRDEAAAEGRGIRPYRHLKPRITNNIYSSRN